MKEVNNKIKLVIVLGAFIILIAACGKSESQEEQVDKALQGAWYYSVSSLAHTKFVFSNKKVESYAIIGNMTSPKMNWGTYQIKEDKIVVDWDSGGVIHINKNSNEVESVEKKRGGAEEFYFTFENDKLRLYSNDGKEYTQEVPE